MFKTKKTGNENHKPARDADSQKHENPEKPKSEPAAKQNDAPQPAPAVPVPETEQKKDSEDRFLRLQADFDNFRKRVIRERNELYAKANEDLMEEMLPVLDHLDLAFKAADEHKDVSAGTIAGFKMVGEQLKTVFSKFGLAEIDAAGRTFDPNLHEAISHIPSDTVPENSVILLTRKGYMLAGRLLRAAQVIVSSGKPASAVEQTLKPDDIER